MPIYKFWNKNNSVTLDKLVIEDMSEDKRSSLIPTQGFMVDEHKIDKNVFMVVNDTFFKLGKAVSKKIFHCLLLRVEDKQIFIVPSKSYVFWNGKSVNPKEYNIIHKPEHDDIYRQIDSGTLVV